MFSTLFWLADFHAMCVDDVSRVGWDFGDFRRFQSVEKESCLFDLDNWYDELTIVRFLVELQLF